MQKIGLVFDKDNNVSVGVIQDVNILSCRVLQSMDVVSLGHKADTLFSAYIINKANKLVNKIGCKSVYLFEDFTEGVLAVFILTEDNNGYIVTDTLEAPVTLHGRMKTHNGIIWTVTSETSRVNQGLLDAIDDTTKQQAVNKDLQNAI